jgi:hypothetical protein
MKKIAVLIEDHCQVPEVWYPFTLCNSYDLPFFCIEIVKFVKWEE